MDQCVPHIGSQIDSSIQANLSSNIKLTGNMQEQAPQKKDQIQSIERIMLQGRNNVTHKQAQNVRRINFNYNRYPVGLNPTFSTNYSLHEQVQLPIPYQKNSYYLEDRPPESKVWWERVPYDKKVIDYEPRMVWVPVQKIQRCQCTIEHIIDYVKQYVTIITPVIEPREVVGYKLQYVPVDKKIIHLPENLVKRQGEGFVLHHKDRLNQPPLKIRESISSKYRTQYVTSENWQIGKNSFVIDDILNDIEGLKSKELDHFSRKDQ